MPWRTCEPARLIPAARTSHPRSGGGALPLAPPRPPRLPPPPPNPRPRCPSPPPAPPQESPRWCRHAAPAPVGMARRESTKSSPRVGAAIPTAISPFTIVGSREGSRETTTTVRNRTALCIPCSSLSRAAVNHDARRRQAFGTHLVVAARHVLQVVRPVRVDDDDARLGCQRWQQLPAPPSGSREESEEMCRDLDRTGAPYRCERRARVS